MITKKPFEPKKMTAIHAPLAFHLLAKPTGSSCNMNCKYCFFLSKERLYPGSTFRMTDDLLEEYIRQYIQCQKVPEVTVAWQGGEPTLMGLDFFRRSIELEKKYKRPSMRVHNTLQTNGILLDDEWCKFFHDHKFLIGLSLDGPRDMHDAYRRDKGGNSTFDRVMRAVRLMQEHDVDFNILATVNAANGDHPIEVYRFFVDEAKAQFIQFVPIVELDNETGYQEGDKVTDRSVKPDQYGRFLISVFDEWIKRDVGVVFVQIFDMALGAWHGEPSGICAFSPTCGTALAMEHNGDLYSCDHFVEPKYFLGNIRDKTMTELVTSEKQRRFGQNKLEGLPRYCRECEVLFACHGECPKNRFVTTPDGEPGLNYLCAGYKAFFHHIDRPMKIMSNLLRQNRAPAEIAAINWQKDIPKMPSPRIGRNDPLSLWKWAQVQTLPWPS